MELRENPHLTASRYFESNNSHFILDAGSPFNRDNNVRYKLAFNEDRSSFNYDENMEVLENNLTYFPGPNDLVNEIIRDCSINNNKLANEAYKQHFSHTDTIPHNLAPNKMIGSAYRPSCSKDVPRGGHFNPRVTFARKSNENICYPTNNDIRTSTEAKQCSEKTTYCRPMLNLYNQQFVQKTMQRNARLQKLVQKLILARKRERQESWNNYINELKNKHGYDRPQSLRISTDNTLDEEDAPELIDDYYDSRNICGKYNPCQNLLRDFYGVSNNMQSIEYDNYLNEYNNISHLHYMMHLYDNDPYCYPMASQGRRMMLQKERDKLRNDFAYELRPRPHSRFYRNNTIVADTDTKRSRAKRRISETKAEVKTNLKPEAKSKQEMKLLPELKPELEPDKKPETKHVCLQTEDRLCCIRGHHLGVEIPGAFLPEQVDTQQIEAKSDQCKKEDEEKGSDLVCCLRKLQQSEEKPKQKKLTGIEGKLDKLIKSINTFVHDIKSKSILHRMSKSTSVCKCIYFASNNEYSDTDLLSKEEQIYYSMVRDGTRSALTLSDNIGSRVRRDNLSKIDRILHEEMDKSNKIKRDIESLLKLRDDTPCSVRITFDIPTQERSTEVTNSLSQATLGKKTIVEETGPSAATNARNMTIAVNTDPLGLLALLRVSTETVKQILSFMPQIDYFSYLSMLQFPQLSRNPVSHYICNICGAAFGRPSQLSDHIQEHNLGNTRDCCVCRHVLDVRHRQSGLYPCRYCGQRFTRAYCCELHQQACARRLGRRHEVASSLMILK